MPLRFPRPVRRSGSSFIYFRQRVPVDVHVPSRGFMVEVSSPDFQAQIRLTPRTRCLKLSLQTRDPVLAQERHALVIGHLQRALRNLRSPPGTEPAFAADIRPRPRMTARPSPPDFACAAAGPATKPVMLLELFDGWARESRPSGGTESGWRSSIREFERFVGTSDGSRIAKDDVRRWKDDLLKRGLKPKTVNDAKLAALRAVFSWAYENSLVNSNPAKDVRVRTRLRAGERMLGFSEDEASAILKAARGQRSPVYRWVPWLCAYTGARVAEIGQLRKQDVRCEDGIWFLDICAAAGSLKGPDSERPVPLHPSLIDEAFLDFVAQSTEGPLFYDPTKRRVTARKPPGKIVGKNVAAWVRGLGLETGRGQRKDSNHAWRHRFKTLARQAGIPDSISDRISGHAPSSQGHSYGGVTLKTLFVEISKLPAFLGCGADIRAAGCPALDTRRGVTRLSGSGDDDEPL